MLKIIEMREPSLSISFELVLSSFVRPLLNATPVFKPSGIWLINDNRREYYAQNREFIELLAKNSSPDLVLICLPSSEIQHENNDKDKLFEYLTAVYNNCFDKLEIKPPLHFKIGLEYQQLRNAYGYTLTLPNPKTPASIIFMQLVTFIDNNLQPVKLRTIGCCFGIDHNRSTIDSALCLSRFVTPTSPGLEGTPVQPIIAEWFIASLFSYLRSKYTSLVVEQRKAIQSIQLSFNPNVIVKFGITLINNQTEDLTNTLKSTLKNWRDINTNREIFKQHLSEKRTNSEQLEHWYRENVPDAFQPDGSSDGVAMELGIDSSVLTDIFSFIGGVEQAEDDAFGAGLELQEDVKDLTQKVLKLKEDRKDQMQKTLVHLTDALRADSANMKSIAILTAFFLPFTFMAILLTTPMFKWPDPKEGEIIIWLPFRIYWAASGGMTLLLGLWGVWLFRPEFIFGKKDKTKV